MMELLLLRLLEYLGWGYRSGSAHASLLSDSYTHCSVVIVSSLARANMVRRVRLM